MERRTAPLEANGGTRPRPRPIVLMRRLNTRLFGRAALMLLLLGLAKVVECQFGSQCEEIKIPMCRNMPYNLTRLPNLLHHSTQENAQLAVDQFELLRWTKCSDQLEFFLCSMYAPICTVEFLSEAIPPCRSVCEAARKGCEPLLARFNIPWPSNLECTSLPLYDRGVCITPEAIISPGGSQNIFFFPRILDFSPFFCFPDSKVIIIIIIISYQQMPRPRQEAVEAPCECGKPKKLREKLYKARKFHYVIRGTVKSVDSFGSLTLTTMTVTEVVRPGRVIVIVGKETYLWTNRSCECPPLTPDEDYIILGWEDSANSRLLYLDGSVAIPYRRRYVRKIKLWEGPIQATTPPSTEPQMPPFPNISSQSSLSFYPDSMQVADSKRDLMRRRNRGNKKKRRRKKAKRRKNRRRRKNKDRNRDRNVTTAIPEN
ncbi:secreted frizzled-related protein 3-like [Macrobrachium nipponense]|uniref:secreted frizzled-related protein 3-like n=1 Tax=Macrobrachium nipponense TaxID=159736 RepID=UPI0030C8D207